jgi:hypothetical protein
MTLIRHVGHLLSLPRALLCYFTMNYMDMSYFAAPPTLGVNAVSTCSEDEQSA